ncbi:uncharacterized protein BJ171DRAFT_443289 [Polychytrium aggregatum]|uniref:uncharacterized protein n=1 Tax=Polychytrium aggregatum TaxID=110093 RepID=UPI0022FE6C56|nr:uncharacterized protein BJ171DRAFT_443289 [Polychytrium aggregatum]KAI9203726.1 hypothetical protein BJ171DRAFT_443289 [Polychytrium aggregatum]
MVVLSLLWAGALASLATLSSASSDSAPVHLQIRTEESQPTVAPDFPHLVGHERLLSWMNRSVDPCHDFYAYTCGGYDAKYANQNPASVLALMGRSNAKLVQNIFEQKIDLSSQSSVDSTLLKKAVSYYQACTDVKLISSRGFSPLRPYAQKIVDYCAPSSNHSVPWIFGKLQEMATPPLFETVYDQVALSSDKGMRLIFDPAPMYQVDPSLVKQVLSVYVTENLIELGDSELDQVAQWIVDLEIAGIGLVKSISSKRDSAMIYEDISTYTNVDDLSSLTNLDWKDYLEALDMQKVKSVYLSGDHDTWISVFKSISKFDRQHLGYFFLWRLACAHFGKLSTPYYDLSGKILQGIVQVRRLDATPYDRVSVYQADCVREMGINLNYLTGYLYVKNAFNDTQLAPAESLTSNILGSFKDMIAVSQWLDQSSKDAAEQKLRSLTEIVGYPDWLSNSQVVVDFHASLEFSPTTYLENAITASSFKGLALSRAHLANETRIGTLMGYPWEVNAFYEQTTLTMQINAGILQRPLFSRNNPDAMNYGSLGTIIGHEVGHAFDSTGYTIDYRGRLHSWWSEESRRNFVSRAKCFADQYGNMTLTLNDGRVVSIDGEVTLTETIADNVGLNAALRAFSGKIGQSQLDLPMDGFAGLTASQVFFISFGQTWCSPLADELVLHRISDKDPHPPSQLRVAGAVANLPEFYTTFQCKPPSASSSAATTNMCTLY